MNNSPSPEAFLSVLDAHKGILYKVARAYGKTEQDRQDLIQEMTLQLWRSFPRYDSHYRYSTWIYRIALNVAISSYRKEKHLDSKTEPFSKHILEYVDSKAGQDNENAEKEEQLAQLYAFLDELRELDRALMLLYLDQKSHKEMAAIMGLSESHVGTKINRIKTALRKKFNQK